MDNMWTRWMKRRQDSDGTVTLDDVAPEHPDQYPAKHLKEKLDARRDAILDHTSGPKGMPEGPDGY